MLPFHIQDFEQLKNKYKNYRTLIANCNLRYFLHTNDYQNAKILVEEYFNYVEK
ncbi:TraM recognition domain-containing protein [Spiroplasma endosymbiont of Notiophilus biguttatus]|uniref:TraM recognition domain-containing protein n=1 Tax=Spiroplasma endosymbiont of Notiophilus biguttatus TaxID=3066285 RepID=UPI00313E681F